MGKVLFRQRGAKFDKGVHKGGFGPCNKPVAKRLGIHAGANPAGDFQKPQEVLAGYFARSVKPSVTAVSLEKGLKRGVNSHNFGAGLAEFLLPSFKIIVGHAANIRK